MNYASNTQSEQGRLYNLLMVKKMCRGKDELILKMVKVFMIQISESVEKIQEAYDQKDIRKMKNEIHKMKPTLSYFGTAKIEKELLILENLLNQNFTSIEIEPKLKSLKVVTNQTVVSMKSDLNMINN